MSSAIAMDPAAGTVLRLGLGLVLLAASRHKLGDFARFRAVLADYRIVPERGVSSVAAALAGAEGITGIWLLVPGAGPVPALAAAALLAVYSAAVAINLIRGRREIDCGCTGPGVRRPLSEGLLLRNAVLILLAASCALPQAARPLVWIDSVTIAAGLGVLLLLQAAVDTSLANAPRLRELRGRS